MDPTPGTVPPVAAWSWPAAAPLRIADGLHLLEPFPVEPFAFYRLTLTSRAATPAYWMLDFAEADGSAIRADNYSTVEPSSDWQRQEFMVMARRLAATARLGFRPIDRALDVHAATIAPVAKEQVLAWMDRLYATLPPVAAAPAAPQRWRFLERSIDTLRRAGALRLVVLGDSVANDMVNGHPHLLIERAWPGSRVTLIHAMEKEKGCPGYQHGNLVEPYVLRHEPDLLVIGGMSFGGDAAAVVSVVHQVRARRPDTDILVVNASITAAGSNSSRAVAPFLAELREAGERERFAVLDLRRPWEEYIARSPQPEAWYHRDTHHACERGKQVLARLFAAFFLPAGTSAGG